MKSPRTQMKDMLVIFMRIIFLSLYLSPTAPSKLGFYNFQVFSCLARHYALVHLRYASVLHQIMLYLSNEVCTHLVWSLLKGSQPWTSKAQIPLPLVEEGTPYLINPSSPYGLLRALLKYIWLLSRDAKVQ